MVLKERDGVDALRRVLAVERGRYLAGRRGEAEPSLAMVEDEAYIYYAKGALVMSALSSLIGETAVNGALREIVSRARSGSGGTTSRELLEALARATPQQHLPRLDEWWNRIVLDDLGVVSAHATPLAGGRYRVDARVRRARSEITSGGENTIAGGEEIEIAVYAAHPDRAQSALAVATVPVNGEADVSILVAERPEYVEIDPRLLRIDRNPDDNLRRIETLAR
jgi:ABC-2 type transport system permease protein